MVCVGIGLILHPAEEDVLEYLQEGGHRNDQLHKCHQTNQDLEKDRAGEWG